MKINKIAEMLKSLPISDDIDIVIKDNEISIKEAVPTQTGPDLDSFLALYLPTDKITKTGGKVTLDMSGLMSGQKFYPILTAVFGNQYNIEPQADGYTIIMTPKKAGESLEESTFDVDKLAKTLDETYKLDVVISENNIIATGDKLDVVAEAIDKEYSDLDIQLEDDKLTINYK